MPRRRRCPRNTARFDRGPAAGTAARNRTEIGAQEGICGRRPRHCRPVRAPPKRAAGGRRERARGRRGAGHSRVAPLPHPRSDRGLAAGGRRGNRPARPERRGRESDHPCHPDFSSPPASAARTMHLLGSRTMQGRPQAIYPTACAARRCRMWQEQRPAAGAAARPRRAERPPRAAVPAAMWRRQ